MSKRKNSWRRVEHLAPALAVSVLALIAYLLGDWKVLVLAPIYMGGAAVL